MARKESSACETLMQLCLAASSCALQREGHGERLIDLVKQRGKRTRQMWRIFIKWSDKVPLEHFTASLTLLSCALYITRLPVLMMTK